MKKYTKKFKEDALRAVDARGSRTIREVADSLGVRTNILHSWRKRALLAEPSEPLPTSGLAGETPASFQKKTFDKLEAEIATLRNIVCALEFEREIFRCLAVKLATGADIGDIIVLSEKKRTGIESGI